MCITIVGAIFPFHFPCLRKSSAWPSHPLLPETISQEEANILGEWLALGRTKGNTKICALYCVVGKKKEKAGWEEKKWETWGCGSVRPTPDSPHCRSGALAHIVDASCFFDRSNHAFPGDFLGHGTMCVPAPPSSFAQLFKGIDGYAGPAVEMARVAAPTEQIEASSARLIPLLAEVR